MSEKLTKAQASALHRLSIGSWYPTGAAVASCKRLEQRGLARGNAFNAYSITDAGRAALTTSTKAS